MDIQPENTQHAPHQSPYLPPAGPAHQLPHPQTPQQQASYTLVLSQKLTVMKNQWTISRIDPAPADIGVVAQKNEDDEDPTKNDIHTVGTVAQILRVLKMPDGNITVILQGKKRFEINEVTTEIPYLKATIKEVEEKRPTKKDTEFQAIVDSIRELAIEIIKESPNIPTEATFAIKNIESHVAIDFSFTLT